MDLIKLPQFPAVAANALSTLVTDDLLGRSVHAILFEQGGTSFTKAHVSNTRIRCNGKTIVDNIGGTNLQAINTYEGLTDTASYFAYWFGDPTARTVRGQHLGDLDLSKYPHPLEIAVNIGAATAPTLQCYALVGAPKKDMGIGFDDVDALMLRAMIYSNIQPSAAVTKKSYGIGLGSEAGARLRQLHFFHTNMTSLEFKKAGFVKFDDISVALNTYVQDEFARVAAAGHYVLDRIVDSNQGEAEATVDPNGRAWPFQVNVTTSAADTIDVHADVHTALALL